MGFVLSILYLVIYYLTPAYLLGPLANAHVEVILALLAIVASVPALMKSFLWKNPQSLAIIGLAIAVFLSVLIGMHWAGGAVQALLGFIPNGMIYFLVCLNFNSTRKLKVLVSVLLFVCLFVIAHGSFDLMRGLPENAPSPGEGFGDPVATGATASPFILRQMNSPTEWTLRLQGLGDINDPNDFGQLIVCAIPLTFIFWRKNKMLQNILFVILPVCILLVGAFLTHSRGALLALVAIVLVAAQRRIGALLSLLLAGGLFVAAMALQFTGGRDISANAGEDRTALWGGSLQLFKSNPLFGVGFGRLPDYLGHTAHNSVAVCAAELGLFGLFFWTLFLFSTARDAVVIASPERLSEGEPITPQVELFQRPTRKIESLGKADINNLGLLTVSSLTGFLVSGWFLSRAFVMTLFLLGGMAEVIYEMALQRGMVTPRLKLARVLPYSLGVAVFLILVLYIMLRILNLMH